MRKQVNITVETDVDKWMEWEQECERKEAKARNRAKAHRAARKAAYRETLRVKRNK